MVDDRPYKAGVVGSSPTVPIERFRVGRFFKRNFFENQTSFGVVVQLVRTLACHARGRGFESRQLRLAKAVASL